MKGLASRAVGYLRMEPLIADSEGQDNDLLHTPLSRLKNPLKIESGYLNDTFFLVSDEDQAREIEEKGSVCYLPQEIQILLVNSRGMDEGTLRDYLNRIHAVKKTFQGSRIQ